MRRKSSFVVVAVAVSVVAANASSALASTTAGMFGDGKPSIYIDWADGEFRIVTDGQPIGLFDILSDVPIFNSTPVYLPPGGLFTQDNTFEKAWASLSGAFGASAFTTDLNFGRIGAPNLGSIDLYQHLTITFSGGFGTPNINGDLILTPTSPDWFPHFRSVTINNVDPNVPGFVEYAWLEPVNGGTFGDLQFDSYVPASGVTGSGPATPATLDAAQRKFHWDSVGSPLGTYQWSVSATNLAGTSTETITVKLVPEPTSAALVAFAAMICSCHCARRLATSGGLF